MNLLLRKLPLLRIPRLSVGSVAVLGSTRARLGQLPISAQFKTRLYWNFTGLSASTTERTICCTNVTTTSTCTSIRTSTTRPSRRLQFKAPVPLLSGMPSCSTSNFNQCFSSQSKPTNIDRVDAAAVNADDDTRKDHSQDVSEHNSDMMIEMEWDHPSKRTEDAVAKDPELRSLLCEIAADFGKSESMKTDDAESMVDKENATSAAMMPVTVGEDCSRSETSFVSVTAEDENSSFVKDASIKCNASFVFSVGDVVDILREENAHDICVIKVPKEKNYVDYFIVVTGRSTRHLSAMTQHINKLYKQKKCEDDPFLIIEGKLTDDWMCLDFGNIVVHFMLEETRILYDLEKLWMLGKEFDDHIQQWDQHEVLLFNPETDLDVEDPGREVKDYPQK